MANVVRFPTHAAPTAPAQSWADRLFGPVDGASLAFFRISFGTVMVWEVLRYFAAGWIGEYYVEPAHHFTFYGFEWIRPWPGAGMYMHFAALGVLGACIAAGLFYRVSCALFALGFTYVFLLEAARFQNHFYLICLLSFLLIFVPAHNTLSLDRRLGISRGDGQAPRWSLWFLRVQLAIPYVYGGIAKLNTDWLAGEPMRTWLLARHSDFPLIGRWFDEPWAADLFSYGGVVFDLTIVPLLLWPRTRFPAFVAVALFHLFNAAFFSIGIFPVLMFLASYLFLPADWPRRLAGSAPGAVLEGGAGRTFLGSRPGSAARVFVLGAIAVYLAIQLLVPLRHFLYPSRCLWSKEGHRFSWRMKLYTHQLGPHTITARDPESGREWTIRVEDLLTEFQRAKGISIPDLILQTAHFAAVEMAARGHPGVEVYVRSYVGLNGRDPQLIVDPAVDLAARRRSFLPADWIVPLQEPLPPSADRSMAEGPRAASFVQQPARTGAGPSEMARSDVRAASFVQQPARTRASQ